MQSTQTQSAPPQGPAMEAGAPTDLQPVALGLTTPWCANKWMDRRSTRDRLVEAWFSLLLMCPHQVWAASSVRAEKSGGGGSRWGVLVPVVPQQVGGSHSSHRDLVRGPTHARHLLNKRVPGRAGGGPQGASSRAQAGQARGLPVKLTWGGLQLRVVPASKQTHTRTHTVNKGPQQDTGR